VKTERGSRGKNKKKLKTLPEPKRVKRSDRKIWRNEGEGEKKRGMEKKGKNHSYEKTKGGPNFGSARVFAVEKKRRD